MEIPPSQDPILSKLLFSPRQVITGSSQYRRKEKKKKKRSLIKVDAPLSPSPRHLCHLATSLLALVAFLMLAQ